MLGYVRVSTIHQKRSGLRLASQKKKLRAHAEAMGFELVEIIEDAGEFANSLRRPGLQDTLDRMEAHEADDLSWAS